MKRVMRSLVFVATDYVLLVLTLLIAFYIRFDFSISGITANFLVYLPLLCALTPVLKIMVFWIFRLYNSLWRYAGAYEVVNVVIASAVANTALSAFLILHYDFTGATIAPRSIFVLTFMLDVFAVGGIRFAYRIYRRIVLGANIDFHKVKRVLIVGAGDAGAIIAKEMKNHLELHQKPVAFVDDDTYKIGNKLNGLPILGPIANIGEIARKNASNEIVIALPKAKPAMLNKIYSECAKTDCRVRILPSVSQIIDESVVMQKIKDVDIEDLLGRDMVELDTNEIANYVKDKIVLVTGAGGSIGSEICRQLAQYGPSKLVMLDNYENNLHDVILELKTKFPSINTVPIIANIREAQRVRDVFLKAAPHIVFHAAAHKHVPLMEWHPEEAIKNNVLGTWNVAEAAYKSGVERFVLISSDKAVNPTNVMGATKRIAEMIIQAFNTKSQTEFVAVRFGNVLGSNGSVIPLFRKQIEQGGPVTVTHPDMTRFFMTIPEAAQLVIQASAFAKGGEIFILDMGQPVKILALAENMIRLSGFSPYDEIPIEFTGIRPGEKLYEELLLSEEGIQKTKNEKIYVAKPGVVDYDMIKKQIDYLNNGASFENNFEVIAFIKNLVPTYIEYKKDE